MTAEAPDAPAHRVADRLRSRRENPWDVFAETIRRFEVHLNGRTVEMVREPLRLEGYGIRDIHPKDGKLGIGFAASTDLSDAGIDRTASEAEVSSRHASFPSPSLDLPDGSGSYPEVETVDRALWTRSEAEIDAFLGDLLAPFESRRDVAPSFGSVRASLVEVSLANSAGLERRFARTVVDFEFAIRTVDGPEGPAPGEYWVTERRTRLDRASVSSEAYDWARKAQDTRKAQPTPSGESAVVFPTAVLADFIPEILGFRLGGSAALRGMMPAAGTPVGGEGLEITDDGLAPFAVGSAPCDDEGTAQRARTLVRAGATLEPIYDAAHAGSFRARSNGGARRGPVGIGPWFHFTSAPAPGASTIVVTPGPGGSDAEIAEAVGEGIWVDQLGYAFPDALSGAFGGELRLGYQIQRGKIAGPVRGGTIGGVLFGGPGTPTLLSSAKWIGSRAQLVGRLRSPPMGVAPFSVSGA